MPRLLTGLVLLGVALRVWAYVSNPSLWLDEILLTRNIVGLPLADLLTRPLLLDQVAPRGFLLVERLTTLVFGQNELVLRLFPFLSGIAGVVLFRRLAERALEGWAVAFAVALFAIAIPFSRHGAEVKQYSVDATAAILLLLIALNLWKREVSTRRLVLAGLAGLVIVLFSQASVLVMAGIGLAFVVEWLISRDRAIGRALVIMMPLWGAAAVVAILLGVASMTPSTREFMDNFWKGGFFPWPMHSAGDVRWFWEQALTVFTDPTLLRYRWPALYLVVALLGIVGLSKRRRDTALLLVGPLVMALVAAIAHQYPFRGRLMFYLIPGLLLSIAAGAEWLRREAGRYHPMLGGGVMAALIVPPVVSLLKAPPPYDVEYHHVMLGYLREHRMPGDVIYVFPLARTGVLYYGPRYGLEPDDWTSGICDRNDTRAYIRDVDRYRGSERLWLLSNSARPYRTARPAVQSYLSTIGVKRDSLTLPSVQFGSVSLELYDLSDPMRLARARAETFPVAPMPTDPRPGCRPWAQPGPLDSLASRGPVR